MKTLAILAALLVIIVVGSAQTQSDKVWFYKAGCTNTNTTDSGAEGCFFFMEDKETKTRCYAFRTMYHDGAAISCVRY